MSAEVTKEESESGAKALLMALRRTAVSGAQGDTGATPSPPHTLSNSLLASDIQA